MSEEEVVDDVGGTRERLRQVQVQLKAPKGQRNTFGSYNYRNCEDILEAVKPLLDKADLTLVLTDEVVMVGDRYYVKAEARVWYGTDSLWVSAFAREEETKKGMDGSQITGAASSYARKYALNGLFLIDDTKDSDATNTGEPKVAQAAPKQPWRNPRAGAMSMKTPEPKPDSFLDDAGVPPYLQETTAATPAERIHGMTITKLGGALQLKGIVDQNMRKDILDAIAVKEYDSFGFMDMSEESAQTLLKKLSPVSVTRDSLLALIPPVE